LHIVGFVAGALAASAIAFAVALGGGFSGWAATGIGAACFVLAQVLYIIVLAGMERAEARRRKAADGASDTPAPKPGRSAVQKS
jgi:high-affinity Fe2+/Pb2+ permease